MNADAPGRSGPRRTPVALGGELSARGLLDGFDRAWFPVPTEDPEVAELHEFLFRDAVAAGDVAMLGGAARFDIAWWCPEQRQVIDIRTVHIGDKVRRLVRSKRWTTTADAAFAAVVEGCRDGRRPRWLTDELVSGFVDLHREGWAHSVEVWEGDELIAGAFGIARGRVVGVESVFHRYSNVAKLVVADLAMRYAGTGARLIDAQAPSALATALGAAALDRRLFMAHLRPAERLRPDTARHPVSWLRARTQDVSVGPTGPQSRPGPASDW